MLWYVLQTKTGGEEKLVEMIHRMVPEKWYGECFVVYHEQLWRRQQKTFVHRKRAFPGYVFITSREPEALFFCLKKLPAMARMMADENFFFLSLEPEEAVFLQQMMDEQHVIGLSYLETDGEGKILYVSGPLRTCASRIVYCRFGKRYAIVRMQLLGKEKEVLFGIILKEDICREIPYRKVEAPIQLPKNDQRERTEAANRGKTKKYADISAKDLISAGDLISVGDLISAGDFVRVIGGAFCGMSGMVYQVKDEMVSIGIPFLGRKVEVEIVPEWLKKIGKRRAETQEKEAE